MFVWLTLNFIVSRMRTLYIVIELGNSLMFARVGDFISRIFCLDKRRRGSSESEASRGAGQRKSHGGRKCTFIESRKRSSRNVVTIVVEDTRNAEVSWIYNQPVNKADVGEKVKRKLDKLENSNAFTIRRTWNIISFIL